MQSQATLNRRTEEDAAPNGRTRCGPCYQPTVDIVERPDELTVVADMPGVKANDIDINFDQGLLTIHGKVAPRGMKNANTLMTEYGVGDYYRTFQVSETIDPARIHAEISEGVLTLHLPKTEAAKPRKITVKESRGFPSGERAK